MWDWRGMKAKTSIEDLEERIEQVVREHIAAIRAGAAAAVSRAFLESTHPGSRPLPPKRTLTRPTLNRRRTEAEVGALAERLCAAVHAMPGETLSRLALKLGATAQELSLPADHLRRAGRLRSLGQRQQTRYFPVIPKTPRAA